LSRSWSHKSGGDGPALIVIAMPAPVRISALLAVFTGRHRAQGVEVGDAVLVLDDDLAIDQRRRAGELGARLDHPAIRAGPVPPMPRELDYDQGPLAVVLDLVNPSLSGRCFRHDRRDFRLEVS
jgi:hypothetical protein